MGRLANGSTETVRELIQELCFADKDIGKDARFVGCRAQFHRGGSYGISGRNIDDNLFFWSNFLDQVNRWNQVRITTDKDKTVTCIFPAVASHSQCDMNVGSFFLRHLE